MENWQIFEVIIVIVSFLTGFISGTWKLSNLMTQNTIKLDMNSERLEEMSKGIDSLTKERLIDKGIYEQKFADHEYRITHLEDDTNKLQDQFKQHEKESGRKEDG